MENLAPVQASVLYKEALLQKTNIDAKIKDLKSELKFNEVSKKITELKKKLYEYMDKNGLLSFQEIPIEDVLPAKVKRSIKQEEKKQVIEEVLSEHIDNDLELSNIVNKIITI